jgi:WD40 repeat protein
VARSEASRFHALSGLSEDGRLAAFAETIAQGDRRPTVQVWDVTTGKRQGSFGVKDGDLRSFLGIGFDRSGKTLVAIALEGLGDGSGGVAYFLRLWDVETGRPLRQWQVTPDVLKRRWEGALRADLSPDGRIAAVGKLNGQVDLWDVASEQKLMTLDLEQDAAITLVAFSPDGKALVVATNLANARLYRVR